MTMRNLRRALVLLLAAGLTACLDMDIVDENRPDRERALGWPEGVEEVIGSLFHVWHNGFTLADVAKSYPMLGEEATNTATQRGVQWSAEPRQALRNEETAAEIWVPRRAWDNFSWTAANANDALREIVNGMRIITVDEGATSRSENTDRAWVWGKLFQGIGLGYLAISMDRAAVATEDTILPTGYDDLLRWERDNIKPWPEVLPVAIRSLEQAIERAQSAAPFLTPTHWIPGQRYDNAQVIQLAHTMIARLLVYSARTPAEREAVDWEKVLHHTARGLTYDWGPLMEPGGFTDGSYLWRLNNTGSSNVNNVLRISNRLLGPADQSGAYQAWVAAPRSERDRFDILTPDRRVHGEPVIDEEGHVTIPNGAYFRYLSSDVGMDPARGRYTFSAYGWWRRANYQDGVNHQNGHYVLASADENRLLRAEALLRTGRIQEAVDLINVTRTRGVKLGNEFTDSNLPPLTVAGAPEVDGECVPRTAEGACGSVMDALMWERQIELLGQDPMRAWHDRRGFGQLQPGTILHMPIPARYLISLGIPLYTFGGVGGDGAAP
jgi:hypothetical protein